MTTQLPKFDTHFSQLIPYETIFTCAWCPKKDSPKLNSHQVYSHGICEKHKKVFLIQYKHTIIQAS